MGDKWHALALLMQFIRTGTCGAEAPSLGGAILELDFTAAPPVVGCGDVFL